MERILLLFEFRINGTPASCRYNPRLVRWLTFALRAGLLALAALVIYLWMVRLGSDLTWDEAPNFRVYARNPITAIGLYHEPNNHILDSSADKSVFVWGSGSTSRTSSA